MLVGLSPGGLCFRSCWLVCRLEGYVLGRVGWSVAWRVMFLVVLVGLPHEGYVLGRVGRFAAWRVMF